MAGVAGFRAGVERAGSGQRKFWSGCARTRRSMESICRLRANTPYANTIPVRLEPLFPGDQELERRIKILIRWNALAMVVRANREEHNIGGHISTYASAATLYEVGFNHFFRARTPEFEGDTVYFQGHAAPGIYARAFLEGRLSAQQAGKFPPRTEAGRRACLRIRIRG